MAFNDVFPLEIDHKIQGDHRKELEVKIYSNVAINMAEAFEEDLINLKKTLDRRNIHTGKIIGVGDLGGITFELVNSDNKPIESAVIRIDAADTVQELPSPNPAAIRKIFQEKEGYFSATIVPRAKKRTFTIDEIKKSLAVLNAEGRLPHLKDVEFKQFMELDGVPMPVLTDISSIDSRPLKNSGFGTITQFLEANNLTPEDIGKSPPGELAKLRRIQDAIHKKVTDEITIKGGMDISPRGKMTGV